MAEHKWLQGNAQLLQTARQARDISDATRQTSGSLSRTTSAHLQRTAREVQNSLVLRIDDVENKRGELTACLDDVLAETDHLAHYKTQSEQAVAGLEYPLDLTKQCQALRLQREGVDKVDDKVDALLRNEAALLAGIRHKFLDVIDLCTEQIRLLRKAHRTLTEDLANK
jgi:hypothetical protein